MKFLIFSVILASAFAQNIQLSPDHNTEIVREEVVRPLGAVYNFLYELSNGIRFQETGSEGSQGQSVATGSYYFRTPEGQDVEVFYTADEGGFQAQSDAIPVDHPLPIHAQEQIQFAAQQRASGVQWDQQGFVI